MQTFLVSLERWSKQIIDVGIAVILALLIVDILFPGSTGIVRNVGEFSRQIPASSQASLVGLLLFLLLYQRRS